MFKTLIYLTLYVSFISGLTAQQRLTFRDVLTRVATSSPELQIEQYKIGFSEADITEAKLRFNPVFNNQFLNLAKNSSLAPGTSHLHPLNRQVWYQLTKPMPLGNIRTKRIDMALKGKTIAELEVEEKKRQTMYEAGITWLKAWRHEIDLEVITLAKDRMDTLVMATEKRMQSGQIPTESFLRTKLLCDEFEIELLHERQEYSDDINDLRLQLNITDSIRLTDEFDERKFSLHADSSIAYALVHRPDYAIEQQIIELNKQNQTLQKARRAPYMELGFLYNPQNTIIYTGTFATLAIPIFDRNQDEVQKSNLALDQSEKSRLFKELQVRNEINKAYTTYVSHFRIMQKYEIVLNEYTQVFNYVRAAYIKDNTTLLDFLEANKTFLETQEEYHNAKYEFRKSYLDLMYYSGMLNTVY